MAENLPAEARTPSGRPSSSTADGWRLIRDCMISRWRGLTLGVIVGLIWTAGKVVVPLLVRGAIDHGVAARDQRALLSWSCAVGGAGLVAAAFTGIRRYWAFRESRWIETTLRDRLFAHVQRLHFGFHDRFRPGDLLSRANSDLQQIQGLVVLVPLTVSNLVTVFVAAAVLFSIDPMLAAASLCVLPGIDHVARRFSRRVQGEVMSIQQEAARVSSVVEQYVAGIRVVKGLGADEFQRARFRDAVDRLYGSSIRAGRIRANHLPLLEMLPSVSLVVVLGYGGHRVMAGDLTVGSLVAFNAYVVLLVWPLRMIGMVVAQAQRAAAAAQRVHEILATSPVIADPAEPLHLPSPASPSSDRSARHRSRKVDHRRPSRGRPAETESPPPLGRVEFSGVTFGYEPGRPVLRGVDLVIEPGECVALVGRTGSGKSTVARLIPRFYDVWEGSVSLDGVDVRRVRLTELRRAVGIVFEDTFLFDASVAANIALADPDAPPERIVAAARAAGAHDFISQLPEGYDTRVGERGHALSGGQRQRISLARAILADPRVLILDDATSAVDAATEEEIREALREVMKGRTTVVIAHRPATISLADRVVVLEGGRVRESGRHDELAARSEFYRDLLAMIDEESGFPAGVRASEGLD
ncbi:MAG: ABC transporter [Acidimicrobiales bacterium]|nr:MAG: ABC transporter [Acidimicrobiales bacterium]